MATSFDALKKNRSKSLDKLNEQLNQIGSKKFTNKDEEKYWKPTRDAAGNGFAIIRFLPEPEGEDFAFVRIWDHAFQGPGGWYIENSRTSLGTNEADPVSELNTKLWNSTTIDDSPERKQARKQKRKLHFISNIYVVKDTANPDSEGKVFLFKYGKKIYDMLNGMMNPSFEDEVRVNPFDLWEGANFRLKIKQVDGYPNYDKSEFDSPAPLFEDDDDLKAVYDKEYPLKDILAPSNFKSYDELAARLNKALGLAPSNRSANASATAEEEDDQVDEQLDMSKLATSKPKAKAAEAPKRTAAPQLVAEPTDGDDDDEDMEYFKNLAARS